MTRRRIRMVAISMAVCSIAWPAYKIYDAKVIYPRQVDKCWNGNRSIESREAICRRLIERTGLSAGKRRRDLRGRAFFYVRTDNLDGALQDAQSMLEIKSDDPWAWVVRGEVFAKQEKWDDAVAALTQAMTNHPNKANPLARRARVYRDKGDFDLALLDYDAVLDLKPKNSNAAKQRVRMYALQGDYDAALQHAEADAENFPNEVWFNEAKGRLYALHLEDAARALELFETNFPDTYYPLTMHFLMGNDAHAEAEVKKLAKISAGEMVDRMNLFQRTVAKFKLEEATKHANLLMEVFVYRELGHANLARARMEEFIQKGGPIGRQLAWTVVLGQKGHNFSKIAFKEVWAEQLGKMKFGLYLDWFERFQ